MLVHLFSLKRVVTAWLLVCVLFVGSRPSAAAGLTPPPDHAPESQTLPIMIACGVYGYFLSYTAYYSRAFAPITGNSGTVYRCGILGIDNLILEEVLDPFHEQLSSDIYNTLIGFESVHQHFFEQEGISNFEYKSRCDLTIESGCPMGAQYSIAFTLSAYTAEDFCLEEWCTCRENWHCEEGLVCGLFFPDIAGSFGECVRAEWWFD